MNLEQLYDSYLKLKERKNLSGKAALKAVKQDGNALRFVANQTEAICLEAVKRNGNTLCYVANQTEAICLEAVKQNGDALRYVANQTEAICLEAVKQKGYTLCYVDENLFLDIIKNMSPTERLLSSSKAVREFKESL